MSCVSSRNTGIIPNTGISACAGSASGNFALIPSCPTRGQIGRIGDQRDDYLLKTLSGYTSGERKGYDPRWTRSRRNYPTPRWVQSRTRTVTPRAVNGIMVIKTGSRNGGGNPNEFCRT
jgi:hypothetical protein